MAVGVIHFALGGDPREHGDLFEVRVVVAGPVRLAHQDLGQVLVVHQAGDFLEHCQEAVSGLGVGLESESAWKFHDRKVRICKLKIGNIKKRTKRV
jgi:hypothetical protein